MKSVLHLAVVGLLFSSCYMSGKISDLNSSTSESISIYKPNLSYDLVSRPAGITVASAYYGGHYYFVHRGLDGKSYLYRSADTTNWTFMSIIPFQQVTSLAIGAGVFVVNSNTSTGFYRSTDGFSWTKISSSYGFRKVKYLNGYFVANQRESSATPPLHFSADGNTWQTTGAAGSQTIWDFAYVNGLFVTVSRNGGFNAVYSGATLSAGVALTLRFADLGFSPNSIAYSSGLGMYVVVGRTGNISTSTNLTAWAPRTADGGYTGDFGDVAFVGSNFVATNGSTQIQTSADGITWTQRSCSTCKGNPYYLNGVLIYPAAKINTSSDGVNWVETSLSSTTVSPSFDDVSTIDLTILDGKLYLNDFDYQKSHSTSDLSTWTTGSWVLKNLAWGGNEFIGHFSNSYDGYDANFNSITVGSSPSSNYQIESLAFGNSNYVSVGYDTSLETPVIEYSTDSGANWTATTSAITTGRLKKIIFGNSLFMSLSTNGQVQTSTNGITWTSRSFAAGYSGTIKSIQYYNNKFLAVGTLGELQTSMDGLSWTRSQPTSVDLNEIIFCRNKYMIYGNSDIFQSDDLLTWKSMTNPSTTSGNLNKSVCFKEKFVISGKMGELLSF